MAKSDIQIRMEAMSGPVARGFAIATIRTMRAQEKLSPRPCPDVLAFLDDAEEQVKQCTTVYEILDMPIARLAGWIAEE